MDYKEIQQVLNKAFNMKESIGYYPPILIEGRAGIGKSSIIKQFAKKKGFEVIDIRLINYSIGDFMTKVPIIEKDVLKNMYNTWLKKLENTEKPVILLLDEIDKAEPEIQRMAYQLILDREVEGLKLSDNVMIIAIQNTEEDGRFFSIEQEKPLFDRFYFRIELEFDPEQWLFNWAIHNLDERVASFLSKNQEIIYMENEEQLIATPRRWEMVSNTIKDEQDLNKIYIYIKAIINEEIATAFIEFIDILNKYKNIENILENEKIDKIRKNDFYPLAPVISSYLKDIILDNPKKASRLIKKISDRAGEEYILFLVKLMYSKIEGEENKEKVVDILSEIDVIYGILDMIIEEGEW
jgi:hypothetical protein